MAEDDRGSGGHCGDRDFQMVESFQKCACV